MSNLYSTYFGTISVKDPTYGAKGDGVTDDRAAIQAAFDAAFGPAGAPHGDTNKSLNREVYFPPGHYMIGGPLYLTNVVGPHIFGAGIGTTILGYNGPQSGNTVAPATGGANAITPLIMTNGVQYGKIERMTLGCNSQNNTCGIYLFQDGTQGDTSSIVFENVFIDSFQTGILIGYQANARCDNCIFINCWFNNNTFAGLRIVNGNAVNHAVYGGGGINNGTLATTGAALYSCGAGNLGPLCNISASNNNLDFYAGGSQMAIIGGSSESLKCAVANGCQLYFSGFAYRNAVTLGCVFVDVTQSGFATLDGCLFQPGNNTGTGTIAALGNVGIVICDNLQYGPEGNSCFFTGSAGSKLYLRGCFFSGQTPLTGFTGTIAQNI